MKKAFPMILELVIGPNDRESKLLSLLSPSKKYSSSLNLITISSKITVEATFSVITCMLLLNTSPFLLIDISSPGVPTILFIYTV